MARVRLFGTEFTADPVSEHPDGWTMRSRGHNARCAGGTIFFAKHSEIVEMAAAERPAGRLSADTPLAEGFKLVGPEEPIGTGLGELETAMAKERETLPSFAEIDAKNGNAGKREARRTEHEKATGNAVDV